MLTQPTVRKRPDTGRWEARWQEGGRRRSKTFERKIDAQAFQARFVVVGRWTFQVSVGEGS